MMRTPRTLTSEDAAPVVASSVAQLQQEQRAPLVELLLKVPVRALAKRIQSSTIADLQAANESLWALKGRLGPGQREGHLSLEDVDQLVCWIDAQIAVFAEKQTRVLQRRRALLSARPYLDPSLAHHYPAPLVRPPASPSMTPPAPPPMTPPAPPPTQNAQGSMPHGEEAKQNHPPTQSTHRTPRLPRGG